MKAVQVATDAEALTALGVDEGVEHDSAVDLRHAQKVEKARMRRRVGRPGAEKMAAVCRALDAARGCWRAGAASGDVGRGVREAEQALPSPARPSIMRRVPEPASPASMTDEEWEEWYRLRPADRWQESEKLWTFYLEVGGSLDPEPDSSSPFDALYPRRALPPHGGPGVRLLRRRGV